MPEPDSCPVVVRPVIFNPPAVVGSVLHRSPARMIIIRDEIIVDDGVDGPRVIDVLGRGREDLIVDGER